jgi:hypothetical protein
MIQTEKGKKTERKGEGKTILPSHNFHKEAHFQGSQRVRFRPRHRSDRRKCTLAAPHRSGALQWPHQRTTSYSGNNAKKFIDERTQASLPTGNTYTISPSLRTHKSMNIFIKKPIEPGMTIESRKFRYSVAEKACAGHGCTHQRVLWGLAEG